MQIRCHLSYFQLISKFHFKSIVTRNCFMERVMIMIVFCPFLHFCQILRISNGKKIRKSHFFLFYFNNNPFLPTILTCTNKKVTSDGRTILVHISRKVTRRFEYGHEKSHKNHCMSYHLLTRISTGMSYHIKYFISRPREFVGVWFLAFFSCTQHPKRWNRSYSRFPCRRVSFVGEISGLLDGKWNENDIWNRKQLPVLAPSILFPLECDADSEVTCNGALSLFLCRNGCKCCARIQCHGMCNTMCNAIHRIIIIISFFGYIDDDVMLGV